MNETMNAIQAFILGLVQGLGEFLPISSSGHLMLAQKIMGFDTSNMLTLNVLLHLATLVAVFAVYWKRFWNMLCHPIKSDLWLLVVATIPAVIAALTINFDAAFEGAFLAWSFLLTSVVLVAAEWLSGHWHRPAKHVTLKHAVIMGVMQAIAILPGLSRSGSTIAGGVGSGLSRKRAAVFTGQSACALPLMATEEVTVRSGDRISCRPYRSPRGQVLPEMATVSPPISAVRWQPMGHTMQINSRFTPFAPPFPR